jgi:nucleotide-binding universal stress UspA family protein
MPLPDALESLAGRAKATGVPMMVRVDANESGMLKPAGASYVKLCKMKVLVPIDGSSPSKRAIRHLLQLGQAHEPLELHLLNVQESADAPQLMRFRKAEEIEQAQLDHGASVLAFAKRQLDRAGVKYHAHVVIGDPAEKIAEFAKKGRFDKIIMGTHGRGGIAGLLMGSVATKVLHLTSVPVTLVK